MVLQAKPPGDGTVGDKGPLPGQPAQIVIKQAFQVYRGYAPLVHHPPGPPPGAPPRAVNRHQVNLGLGSTLHRQGQVPGAVGAGLEENELGARLPQALHLLEEALGIHHPQARMPFKLPEGPRPEGLLDRRVLRVGEDDIAPLLELEGPFQAGELDLTAYTFGPLAPFDLYDLYPQLLYDILRHPQPAVLHIELSHHSAIAVIPFLEGPYPPLHLRGADNATVLDLGLRVHGADILPYNHHGAGDGSPYRTTLPVHLGYLGGAHGPGKEGHPEFDLVPGPHLRGHLHLGKDGPVGVGSRPHRPHTASLDVEMGEVNRKFLLRPSDNLAKGLGIDNRPPLDR